MADRLSTKVILMETQITPRNDRICSRTEIVKVDKSIDEILGLMGASEEKIANIKMARYRTPSCV